MFSWRLFLYLENTKKGFMTPIEIRCVFEIHFRAFFHCIKCAQRWWSHNGGFIFMWFNDFRFARLLAKTRNQLNEWKRKLHKIIHSFSSCFFFLNFYLFFWWWCFFRQLDAVLLFVHARLRLSQWFFFFHLFVSHCWAMIKCT